jgi:hypothetical protein
VCFYLVKEEHQKSYQARVCMFSAWNLRSHLQQIIVGCNERQSTERYVPCVCMYVCVCEILICGMYVRITPLITHSLTQSINDVADGDRSITKKRPNRFKDCLSVRQSQSLSNEGNKRDQIVVIEFQL